MEINLNCFCYILNLRWRYTQYCLHFDIIQSDCVLLVFLGHKDSVHCVGFSHDSLLIATGDMLGNIKVWNKDTHEEVFSDSIPVEETDVEEQDEKEKEDLMVP